MTKLEITDIRINLKYGQIAAKWWGSKQKRPILLLHGWQDCAGSFDTLIPLLPREYSYLAVDFPGHGFSDHLPKGCYYHYVDLVPLLEEIRLYFNWKRISIIGHSMGAIVSCFYATVLSDNVDLVVALDTLKMQNMHPKVASRIYFWKTKRLIELNRILSAESPEYNYDEMVRRVHEGSMRSVDIDKAKYMIERGSKPSPTHPEQFYFTRDIRAKFMQPFYVEQSIGLDYIKQIRAPYLFIRSDDRDFAESEKNIREAVEHFKKYNKHFEFLKVKGTHHVHLNHPELMADKISQFLHKHHVQEEQPSDSVGLKHKL